MGYLLGIDLGTSSIKAVALSENGCIAGIGQQSYEFSIPKPGYAEQDPDTWYRALCDALSQLAAKGVALKEIAAVGFSGQMHGLVPVDRDGRALRNAILWCDQRAAKQLSYVRSLFSNEQLAQMVQNPVAAGFQLVSALWMKENEPALYEKTALFLLPKDYLRLKLTGECGTDFSDAASTLAFDCANGCWCEPVINGCGLETQKYPKVFDSHAVAGYLTQTAARETGLPAGIPVVYGGADQPVQAIANGVFTPKTASSTIGTGGQLLLPLDRCVCDSNLRTHTFCHVLPGQWYLMGAMLGAGLSLKWLSTLLGIDYKQVDGMLTGRKPGSNGLLFLPYLTGARTPDMDINAKALFWGLTISHTREDLIQSVMEGVVFSLRQSLDIAGTLGGDPNRIVASGGGISSKVWLQMQADIYQKEIVVSAQTELAGVGAAMLAGIGNRVWKDVPEAFSVTGRFRPEPIVPDATHLGRYTELYGLYKELYGANRALFEKAAGLGE